jgi:hypothetical protein
VGRDKGRYGRPLLYRGFGHVPEYDYMICHQHFREMFQVQCSIVLQHSLLQFAGIKGEVYGLI